MHARELSGETPAANARSLRGPASAHRGSAVAAQALMLQRSAGNRAVLAAVRAGIIGAQRRAPARLVQTLQVKNPFEDPAASRDARSATAALDAYRGLSEEQRRECVKATDKKDLRRLLAALSLTDQLGTYRDGLTEIGRWVQEEETRAYAGMTDEQMATEQMNFVNQAEDAAAAKAAGERAGRTAAAAAKSVGAAAAAANRRTAPATSARRRRARAAAIGRPPPKQSAAEAEDIVRKVASTPEKRQIFTDWPDWLQDELAALTERGNKAVKKVVDYAKAKHPELGLESTHFQFEFEYPEDKGGALASSVHDGAGGWRAAVGRAFVKAAELDPAYVMYIVVHELYGHPEYPSETTYFRPLYDAATATMDRSTADWDAESFFVGYEESEVRAAMRDLPYYTQPNGADLANLHPDFRLDPATRVALFVGNIKKRWSPRLIVALLRGFRMRQAIDPRITPAALQAFDEAVLRNFDAATLGKVKN